MPNPEPQSSPSENRKPGVNPWLIALAVILPAFMEVIDTSIAAVCIPYIAGSVSASNDQATWVLTFYLLSNAVVLPASAWFSLRFGRKRFLITSIIIFTIASFFCGAANSLIIILVARLIQGAGGGALQPLSQAILTESFPPEKRGMAMGLFGLGVVVAPILGPTLGGWLTDTYSWRWAFYINIPVGVLAVFLISRFIEDPPYIANAKPGKLDGVGFGFLALWLGAMQIVLDRGQQDDWFGSTTIRWLTGTMIVCFIAFIITQLTREKPLVDLTIFKNRNFALGCVLIFMFGAAIYGAVTILPLFYQTLMGYSAFAAGIAVAPRGLGSIIAMPLVGFLVAKIDARILTSTGFLIFAICSLFWGHITLDISPMSLFWPIVISGFSLGLVFVPLSTVTLGDLPSERVGNGSGLYNLMRNVGGSVGISLVTTLVARNAQVQQVFLAAHLTPYDAAYRSGVQSAASALAAAGQASAPQKALGLMYSALLGQSELLAFLNNFRWFALMCVLCIAGALFFKKSQARGPIVAH